jgi:hypothetical protein
MLIRLLLGGFPVWFCKTSCGMPIFRCLSYVKNHLSLQRRWRNQWASEKSETLGLTLTLSPSLDIVSSVIHPVICIQIKDPFIPHVFASHSRKQCTNKVIPTISSADSLALNAVNQLPRWHFVLPITPSWSSWTILNLLLIHLFGNTCGILFFPEHQNVLQWETPPFHQDKYEIIKNIKNTSCIIPQWWNQN